MCSYVWGKLQEFGARKITCKDGDLHDVGSGCAVVPGEKYPYLAEVTQQHKTLRK